MTKISNMVTAGPLMGSELIEVVQGGVNKQITAGQLFSSGKSSYQLAVDRGFVGSEASFLASLKGTQGVQGVQGVEGVFGTLKAPMVSRVLKAQMAFKASQAPLAQQALQVSKASQALMALLAPKVMRASKVFLVSMARLVPKGILD
jgi:hypothetical protein